MRIGFVGLGKMGNQIVQKLLSDQHEVVVYDVNQAAVAACTQLGARAAESREDLVKQLGSDSVIWLMIPAAYVQGEVDAYRELLAPGSILVDGGNSRYTETQQRATQLSEKGISFVDIGTSGGILGLQSGFSLMAGSSPEDYERLLPVLQTLSLPHGGHVHAGPVGYGHYVKMVHNGIEYALMQAYAEGYDLMKYGPLPNINLAAVAAVWQQGSIVSSTLNGLIAETLTKNPELDGIDGFVASSGEGSWTKETADTVPVAMPALQAALDVRAASQAGRINFATKLLAATRNAFGGHAVNKES